MRKPTVNEALGRYLNIRSRSEKEIRRYLQQRIEKYHLSEKDIEELVEKYRRMGLINDEQFAESVTHSLVRNKGRGPRFVKMKLQMAGVSKEAIGEALQTISHEDLFASMHKRLAKYERKLAVLDGKMKRLKAYQILATSGFPSGEISRFIDDWLKKE
jgi:SOS response regulatory protein OraA/RecX